MILIFGAAGFCGTSLSDQLLKDGYEVIASDVIEIGEAFSREQGIPNHRVDVTQKAELERMPTAGIQAVVAAIAGPLPAAVLIDERLVDPSRWGSL